MRMMLYLLSAILIPSLGVLAVASAQPEGGPANRYTGKTASGTNIVLDRQGNELKLTLSNGWEMTKVAIKDNSFSGLAKADDRTLSASGTFEKNEVKLRLQRSAGKAYAEPEDVTLVRDR